MRKALLFFSFIVAFVACISLGNCDEDAKKRVTKTAEGQIAAIDWVGCVIVVRWLPAYRDKYDEISLFVPEGAVITKGTDTIGFADLNESDKVLVTYYDASPGPLTVISIMIYI